MKETVSVSSSVTVKPAVASPARRWLAEAERTAVHRADDYRDFRPR